MSERVSPPVRVRPVRGRVIDPFRGMPEGEDKRLDSRAVDAQPIDDVVAVLERLPNVKLTRAGRRFTLGRGHDVIRVAFASAARRVSLDDATFEGDGNLVITVLHALLPLFGAVEVRIGEGGVYRTLIDGHDSLQTLLEMYDAWWIEESLKLAAQMKERDAATAAAAAAAKTRREAARSAPAPYPVNEDAGTRMAEQRASGRRKIAMGIALVTLAFGLGYGVYRANKGAAVGAYCEKNDECDSEKCLPREPVTMSTYSGIYIGGPPKPSDPSGVCTRSCAFDSDCPSDMACGRVISYGGYTSIGHETSSCIPRAWH